MPHLKLQIVCRMVVAKWYMKASIISELLFFLNQGDRHFRSITQNTNIKFYHMLENIAVALMLLHSEV